MMTERFDQRVRVDFGPNTLLGFWASGKNNYVHLGIEMPGIKKRNVHLTLGRVNNNLDCHISDYNYIKGIRTEPWRSDPFSIDDLESIFEEFIDSLVCEYDEDEEYQEFDLPSYARFADDIDWEGRKVARFDMLPMFQGIASGTLSQKRRIFDGYLNGMNPGIIQQQGIPIFIIPFEENHMLKFDFKNSNPLFKEVPLFEGIEFLFEYLGKQGLLEKNFKRNMPSTEEIEAAILGVISRKDIVNENTYSE